MDLVLLCFASGPNRTYSQRSILGSLSSRSSWNETFQILNSMVSKKADCLVQPTVHRELGLWSATSHHVSPQGMSLRLSVEILTQLVFFSQIIAVLIPIFRPRVNLRCTICWLTEHLIIQWLIWAFLKESSFRVASSQIGGLCSPHFWLN